MAPNLGMAKVVTLPKADGDGEGGSSTNVVAKVVASAVFYPNNVTKGPGTFRTFDFQPTPSILNIF